MHLVLVHSLHSVAWESVRAIPASFSLSRWRRRRGVEPLQLQLGRLIFGVVGRAVLGRELQERTRVCRRPPFDLVHSGVEICFADLAVPPACACGVLRRRLHGLGIGPTEKRIRSPQQRLAVQAGTRLPHHRRSIRATLDNNRAWPVGIALENSRRWEEALDYYQKSLAVFSKLAALDPANAGFQRELARGELLADLEGFPIVRDDRRRAEKAGSARGRAIDAKLSAADPRNAAWQDYLALDYVRVANVLLLIGRSEEGFDTFRKSIAVREKLTVERSQDR
jgi:tetratricopeptide (TPR) repeat protein